MNALRGRKVDVLILLVYLVALAAVVFINHREQERGLARDRTAATAICRLTDDLRRRVAESKAYLRKHPDGAPALGLTRADILRGIAGQERTIRALSVVHCDD